MTEKSPQSDEMRRYVLGSLSEEGQEAFELRYFGDPALLEEVQSLRDELLDEYLSGALEPAEHEFLTARLARSVVWRDKAAALQALRDRARALSPPPSTLGVPAPDVVVNPLVRSASRFWHSRFWHSWFDFTSPVRWATLVAGLMLLSLGIWLANHRSKQPTPTIAANLTPTPNELVSSATPAVMPTPTAVTKPAVSNAKPHIATFSLLLNLTRQTGDTAVLTLKPGTRQLELQLDLGTVADDAVAAFYQVSLHNAADQRIWHNSRVVARSMQGRRVLLLMFPAQLVTAGRYELRLRSNQPSETEATLPFNVQVY